MRIEEDSVAGRAIDWHVRRHDLDAAGWEAFVAWLEEDPAHARAYDRIATMDRLLPDAPAPLPIPANDDEPRYRRRMIAGGAVAAALAVLAVPGLLPRGAQPYAVETAPGRGRTVTLADGTAIDVAGGSRLMLNRANLRTASLERGEAVFHVRHDAGAPFTVTSGGVAVRDLGTVFDVARDGAHLSVAVAEGSVLFQPDADAVRLAPGDAIEVREDRRTLVRRHVAPASVGGWRRGELSFDAAPLAEVAGAVHRASGAEVRLGGDLPQRVFTGMVRVTGAADRDVPHFAALIGARWQRRGDEWILDPEVVAPR